MEYEYNKIEWNYAILGQNELILRWLYCEVRLKVKWLDSEISLKTSLSS